MRTLLTDYLLSCNSYVLSIQGVNVINHCDQTRTRGDQYSDLVYRTMFVMGSLESQSNEALEFTEHKMRLCNFLIRMFSENSKQVYFKLIRSESAVDWADEILLISPNNSLKLDIVKQDVKVLNEFTKDYSESGYLAIIKFVMVRLQTSSEINCVYETKFGLEYVNSLNERESSKENAYGFLIEN